MAVDYLDNRPLHLSFDIDSCDPGEQDSDLTHSLTHSLAKPSHHRRARRFVAG